MQLTEKSKTELEAKIEKVFDHGASKKRVFIMMKVFIEGKGLEMFSKENLS